MKKHLPIFSVRIVLMLTEELISTERNQNDLEVSATCEAAGCYSMATERIIVKVGNVGTIPSLLCSNCVTKFQDEGTNMISKDNDNLYKECPSNRLKFEEQRKIHELGHNMTKAIDESSSLYLVRENDLFRVEADLSRIQRN